MVAILGVSTEEYIELLNHYVVHLKLNVTYMKLNVTYLMKLNVTVHQ